MTDQQLYKSAVDFLLSFDSVTQEDLDLHLTSDHEKPKDLKIIYRQLCESAQNKQMSPKVIGSAIGGVDNLKKVLHEFDPHKVASTYGKTDMVLRFIHGLSARCLSLPVHSGKPLTTCTPKSIAFLIPIYGHFKQPFLSSHPAAS